MIRQIILAAATLGVPMSALPANAREAPSRWMGDLASRIDNRTIQCIVGRDPNLIVSWFSTLPGSSQERKLFSRLEDQFIRCFRTNKSQMVDWVPQYDYRAMRVAILQYLLKSGSVAVPELRPAGLDKAAWYAKEGSIPPESVVANDLGFCLAKTNWPAARTVVLSGRGSVEEAAALRTLVPLVGGCIPTGATLKIDRPRLREILEETVYHAAGGVTASGLSSAS